MRIEGGTVSGFDTGITKGTATLTRVSMLNSVATGNTNNTTLSSAEITQIGTCSGVAI